MVQTLDTTLTVEEFLDSPEAAAKPAWEYLPPGRLVRKVSPSLEHSIVQVHLSHRLLGYVEAAGIEAEVLSEGRVILPTSSPVPDVAVYHGRLPPGRDGALPKYAFGPPALAVEIMSPGQTRKELVERCELFVAAGTALALLVLPRAREIVAVTAEGQQVFRGQDPLPLQLAPGLAGLRLTVADVFARLP